MPIDVLIPLGSNDEDIIERCVESVRTYILGVRNIYIVSSRPLQIKGATQVLDESIFPFTKEEIGKIVLEKRAGWYLQQLIKLYGPLLIQGCLPNCLIVDADVIFFKKLRFMDGSKYLFDKNHETHSPYFSHMKRLHPSFLPAFRTTSGIVNVMIYNQEILKEIFKLVEEHHKEVFWKAFLKQVGPNEFSGASEYEIYFHYINRVHPKKVKLRALQYYNFGQRTKIEGGDWDYVTYHYHLQKNNNK
jgi:hypothetical protein